MDGEALPFTASLFLYMYGNTLSVGRLSWLEHFELGEEEKIVFIDTTTTATTTK